MLNISCLLSGKTVNKWTFTPPPLTPLPRHQSPHTRQHPTPPPGRHPSCCSRSSLQCGWSHPCTCTGSSTWNRSPSPCFHWQLWAPPPCSAPGFLTSWFQPVQKSRFSRIVQNSREFSLLDLDLEAFWFHFSLLEKEWKHFDFTLHFSKKSESIFFSLCTSRKRVKAFYFHFSLLELQKPTLAGPCSEWGICKEYK